MAGDPEQHPTEHQRQHCTLIPIFAHRRAPDQSHPQAGTGKMGADHVMLFFHLLPLLEGAGYLRPASRHECVTGGKECPARQRSLAIAAGERQQRSRRGVSISEERCATFTTPVCRAGIVPKDVVANPAMDLRIDKHIEG
jgi:hypothetical protein